MTEIFNTLSTMPQAIQVLVLILSLIGLYFVYRFRYIVGLISAGAIALYLSLKKKR